MSASEKLKALDAELSMLPQDDMEMMRHHQARNAAVAALPQIVAVVEAAERNQPFVVEDRFLSDDEAAFKAALAALDEALRLLEVEA